MTMALKKPEAGERSKPDSYDELFPGRFLKAGLFKGKEVTLRIAEVYQELMPDKKGTVINSEGERCKKQTIFKVETPQGAGSSRRSRSTRPTRSRRS
jgi:hypothetical protein